MSTFEQNSFGSSVDNVCKIVPPEQVLRMKDMTLDEIDAQLNNLPWYQKLPSEMKPTDVRRRCSLCDGYGNIFDKNGRASLCTCQTTIKPGNLSDTYQALDALMRSEHWEGWPVTTFAEFQKQQGFIKTKPFIFAQALWNDIKGKGTGQGKALVLCGSNGGGKTHSGLLLCAEAALAGHWATAIEFNRVVDFMKRGIDGQQKLNAIYSSLERAEFALVDEVGKETTSGNMDHAKEAIQRIIDIFYNPRKTLVIASNMTLKEMDTYLPTRSKSRITSGWGSFVEIPMGSPDLRRNHV